MPDHPAAAQPIATAIPIGALNNDPSLTPAMRRVLAGIAKAQRRPMQSMTPPEARRFYQSGAEVLDLPRAPLPRVEDISLSLPGRMLGARLFAPDATRLPVLLYLHGGGFTVGGPDTHDSLCRQLALLGGVAVLSLDYRLAPEHRFPAAVDDAWEALCWLRDHANSLGLDGTRLAVGGDSAGGTLAAVTALHARDAGFDLALQLLITPGTHSQGDTESRRRFAEGYLIDRDLVEWFFGNYIDVETRTDWRFAPSLAPEFEGLAPAWIGLAECDPLVDEGVAYGDALRMAGVAVELEIYKGVTHDFVKMGRALPEALQAHAAMGAALRQALGTEASRV